MKSSRQVQREARQLFQLCVADVALDETRVRRVAQGIINAGRPGGLAILSRFQRLVRLDRSRHRADVQSAVPLPADLRERIEAALAGLHGPGIVASFTANPDLLGGVRVKVGSDVYDGSVKAALRALEARF